MRGRLASVRFRLTVWNVSVLALVLIALGVVVRLTTQALLMGSMDRDLTLRAESMAANWADRNREHPGPPPGPGPFGPGIGSILESPPGPPPPRKQPPNDPFARFRPRLVDTNGSPLEPWEKTVPWDMGLVKASARGRTVYATIEYGGERVRVLSMPLVRDRQVAGVLQMASSLAETDPALGGLGLTLFIMIPLALIACGITGVFLTSRAMRPVKAITDASARIGAGNRSERLTVSGGDEFAQLATTINEMLGRLDSAFTQLEQAFEQQMRFTADASHELRSPLTAIKGNASLALYGDRSAADYRKALEATDRAADSMNRIVQDLLFLARADAGQIRLDLRPVPVEEILSSAVETVQGATLPDIRIRTPDSGLTVCGDRSSLIRVISNLLHNAVRHTPAEGQIDLDAAGAGDWVLIRVADTGEGIPPGHLPHVFERFYRVDAARARAHGGTGLGLAICQSIAQAHGGSISISSVAGEGTTVFVSLPRAASPQRAPAPESPVSAPTPTSSR